MNSDHDGYVLRSYDQNELDRLSLQHRVWKSETDRVIAHAAFRAGDQLADLGCGPGYLSADLARLVAPDGHVLAIDNSALFIEQARSLAEQEGLSWIDARISDLSDLRLDDSSLDGAVCRWVLMYLPDARDLIRRVVQALKPGGRFVVMEYFQFRSSALWPEGRSFARVFDAVRTVIRSRGGDPDIGGQVPAMLEAAGCDVVELQPILRVGRPGSVLWDWMEGTGRNHGTLVAEGLLSDSDIEAFEREWREQASLPHAFFSAPPVLATIGCKR